MIVIGTDTHKRTHTCGAVDALTAAARGELTVPARNGSFGKLLRWARALDPERVWAIEDCRHVSGALERFLVARGERIVRVAPKHMAGARRSSRERGKSDSIDAFSVARAALKEGHRRSSPARTWTARRSIFACWSTIARTSIAARTSDQQRLRWHLHDLWPELEIPHGALDTAKWLGKASRRLARAEQTTRVRIARELVRQITASTKRIRELESRARRARRELRAAAARRARLRAADRRQADRRDRRRRPIRHRRQARPHRRQRPDPRLLGQHPATPPRPRRQPPAQLRPSPPRRQQSQLGPRHRRLPRPQTSRRQVTQRSTPLRQTPPRPPRLETPPRPHPGSRPSLEQQHQHQHQRQHRPNHRRRPTSCPAPDNHPQPDSRKQRQPIDIGATSVVQSAMRVCPRKCVGMNERQRHAFNQRSSSCFSECLSTGWRRRRAARRAAGAPAWDP